MTNILSNYINTVSKPKPVDLSQFGQSKIPTANVSAVNTNPVKPALPSTSPKSAYTASLATQPSPVTAPQPTSTPTPSSTSNSSSSQSAYLKYLTGMFDPTNVDNARKSYEDSQKRLADIQNQEEKRSLDARREQEGILASSGGLTEGARSSANEAGRKSNSELADLALQESAAARSAQVAQSTYQQYIDAGKSVYEAEQAAEKARKDDAQQSFTNDLATKKFEEDKRQFGLQYALDSRKASQPTKEKLAAADQQKAVEQQTTQALSLVNSILPKASAITGIGQNPLNYVGLSNGKTLNEYNQLQSLLKLGTRQLIKGQGAVSDYESKILGDAASSLGRNLSNKDFEEALKKTRGVLKTNAGMVTTVEVINPETGEKVTADLSGSEIYHLVSEGNIVNYQ